MRRCPKAVILRNEVTKNLGEGLLDKSVVSLPLHPSLDHPLLSG